MSNVVVLGRLVIFFLITQIGGPIRLESIVSRQSIFDYPIEFSEWTGTLAIID